MLNRALWGLFVGFAAVALFAAVRAATFVGQPFPGFLVYPNGMVTMFGSDAWPGLRAGLEPWDLVRAIDGQPVETADEILSHVRARPPGTAFVYEIEREGRRFTVSIPSIEFGIGDFVAEPLPFIVTSAVYAIAGVAAHTLRPTPATFALGAFGLALGAALLRLDFVAGSLGAELLQPMPPLIAAAMIHLALVFPIRPQVLIRRPGLLLLPYGLAAVLGAARAVFLFRSPETWVRLDQATFVYGVVAIAFLLGRFVQAARQPGDAVARERARAVLWGLVPAVGVAVAGSLLHATTSAHGTAAFLMLAAAWIWLGFLAYAAAKRNIFDFEIFVRRTLTFGITAGATIGAYVIGLVVSYALLTRVGYSTRATLPVLATAFAVLFIPGVFRRFQEEIESRLFPRRGRLLAVVGTLSAEIAELMPTLDLGERIRTTLRERVGVSDARLWIRTHGGFVPLGEVASPLEAFPGLSQGRALSIFEVDDEPTLAWMRAHGCTLLVPAVARDRLEGFLVLGELEGGRLFNSEDVDALLVLGSRIAISLVNGRAVDRIRALEARLREENQALREELELHPGFPEIVGQSAPMKELFRLVDQVAATDTTVLLLGETGTGKGLVAQAIHARSTRKDGPLIAVNCAAIPAELIESELFGHERGAFTDAISRRRGRFELAATGTILLDEIGELPLAVQSKLLRVLQERELERIGGTETLRVTARVIASTNRDLRAAVAEGSFREDLYFRLAVFPIVVPPLRERADDLPLLVEHLTRRFSREMNKRVGALDDESLAELAAWDWPGNVRELENVIERAMVLSRDDTLRIPPLGSPRRTPPHGEEPVRPLAEELRSAKIAVIGDALAVAGTQVAAADLLGLRPSSLSRMMRDLGIRR